MTVAVRTAPESTPEYLFETVPEMVAVPSWLSTTVIPLGNPVPLMTGTAVVQVVTVKLNGVPDTAVAELALVMVGGLQCVTVPKVNSSPALAAEVPDGVVTVVSTVPAASAGVVDVIEVAESTV